MQAASGSSFQPVEAGAILAGAVGTCGGTGALIGWAAGSTAYGTLGGVVVGIPAGIYAVYRRYRDYFA